MGFIVFLVSHLILQFIMLKGISDDLLQTTDESINLLAYSLGISAALLLLCLILLQEFIDKKLALNVKKVSELEYRYTSLFEHSIDAVITVNAHGIITSANPAVESISGYKPQELINKPFSIFIAEKDLQDALEIFEKVTSGKAQFFETNGVDKWGKQRRISGTAIPKFINGKMTGSINIVRDITEKEHMEGLVRRTEKLSVLGELAAGIAHEIRNPLTSLKGFLQLLQNQHANEKKYYDIMLAELERINFIVNEFMVLAKPQVINFKIHNLKVIMDDVVTLLSTQAILNNVKILFKWDKNLPLLRCEEKQLKQVLINILKNAIEAMPEGGKIYIIVTKIKGKKILIRFVDQGQGIRPERLAKIGEPFYTTKERGTGLGLMVSYRIIEAHQGSIHFASEVNKGTKVDIYLPINQLEKP